MVASNYFVVMLVSSQRATLITQRPVRALIVTCLRFSLQYFPNLISIVTAVNMGNLHALHKATAHSSTELLKLLIEFPYPDNLLKYTVTADKRYCYKSAYDINACNLQSWTPLHLATVSGKADMVEYLLSIRVTGGFGKAL